jgi:cyclic pyranopterin monophosphate synthase
MGMIDISDKPVISRLAVASGVINLKKDTIKKIMSGNIKKGDPIQAAEIAAMQAVKKTPEFLAYCHPIPIENVGVDFKFEDDKITVEVTVKAMAKTGVEMECLQGITTALNTIWDLVKYLEKDEKGQYLDTSITNVKVLKKIKSEKL